MNDQIIVHKNGELEFKVSVNSKTQSKQSRMVV